MLSGDLWPHSHANNHSVNEHHLSLLVLRCLCFPGGASGIEPTYLCRRCKRLRFDPWSGRSPGGGYGNLLQYSCLVNPMDRGAWWATIHRVTKRYNWSDLAGMHTHTRAHLGDVQQYDVYGKAGGMSFGIQ